VKIGLLALILLSLAIPSSVSAHAFGAQYNLPVPVWLYLYSGAAAVIVSFIVVGVFLNQKRTSFNSPSKALFHLPRWGHQVLKYLGLSLFLLTILTGLLGTNNSLLNFNMTFFWIIFFLGLTYLIGLSGDIWPYLNPLKTITELVEKRAGSFEGVIRYPKNLSHLPALISYFLLIWIELVSRVTPYTLSLRIIIYSLISFIFIYLFGKKVWLEYFDFFSLFFRLIGKVSLRTPFALVKTRAQSLVEVLFILFMLSSTAYDGFHSTQAWYKFEFSYLVGIEQSLGDLGFILIQTLALIFSALLFFTLYMSVVAVIKILLKSKKSVRELALDFGYTLVPIAFVYNIAHYYTLLLIQGQSIISLVSDPFGFGWNLFGTVNFIPNIGLIRADVIWNSQVGLIILGHVAGVYTAHLVALKVFPTQRQAVLSQFPMLLLMVLYTVAGLWILAQPFATGG
jgi:hypothetical protein